MTPKTNVVKHSVNTNNTVEIYCFREGISSRTRKTLFLKNNYTCAKPSDNYL